MGVRPDRSGRCRDGSRDWLLVPRLLGRLIIPVRCAGCGRYDIAWCRSCQGAWVPAGFRCELQVPRLNRSDSITLPVWALTAYDGASRLAILAAKAGGRHDLHPVMASRLAYAAWCRRAALAVNQDRIAVVPVPSSSRAIRERGADMTGLLAREVARNCGWQMAALLCTSGRKRDQVGLGRAARQRNIAGTIQVVHRRLSPQFRQAVLIDDIVTSGATLHHSRKALEACGIRVVGAMVLAATAP